MLSPNVVQVLHAVAALHKVSGYNPTIGEVAKVAGVSYGVATRALEKLCGLQYVDCHTALTERVKYRFSSNGFGLQVLLAKGRS